MTPLITWHLSEIKHSAAFWNCGRSKVPKAETVMRVFVLDKNVDISKILTDRYFQDIDFFARPLLQPS